LYAGVVGDGGASEGKNSDAFVAVGITGGTWEKLLR
jgi:hypothetical protein